MPADLPGRRHHRRVEPDPQPSTGRRRTTTSSAPSSARPSTAPASCTCRATTTGRSATTTGWCSATSRSASRPCTRRPTAAASWCCTATSSTASSAPVRMLESLGSRAYAAVLRLNRYVNAARRRFGYPYWSMAAFLKHKVKNAVKYIANFERALAVEARRRGVHGVICGHIHRAEISRDRRHHLLQRRRLGRELHDAGGGLPGPAEPAALDGDRRGAGGVAGAAAAGRRGRPGSGRMRLALVTDAWLPQVNGVVRTLGNTIREIEAAGHEVTVISPAEFRTIPCPTYPEIRLALFAGRAVRRRLDALDPDAVHVSTEGPLGLAARNWCLRHGRPFTTAYHTQFPEYVRARAPIPLSAGLCRRALVPRSRHPHAGDHTVDAAPARGARLAQPAPVGPRRGHRVVPPARQGLPRPAAADLAVLRARRGGEGHRRFPRPRPAGHQARGGRRPGVRRAEASLSDRPSSPATATARILPHTSRRATCSSSRAAPTRSASCCSRRWPAAFRLRRIRSPGRSTWCSTVSPAY